ncbi:MAG TPA: 2-oxoglutarate dehydrogenase E1 component [Longimicrobiaceae bacterium]|nr:2-oxoglutarate dehydrogenase E1 component [Longimicrobiaceae bacterium]
MADIRDFHGPNAGYVLELYERYLQDPAAVDAGWQQYFRSFAPPTPEGVATPTVVPAAVLAGVELETVVAAHELAEAIRARGHTAARLSPISAPDDPDPALRPESHGISAADLERLPASVVRGPAAQGAHSAAEGIARLRELYSGTIGYEFDHIQNPIEREWLRQRVESGSLCTPLDVGQRRALLRRLSQVEGFERYLHRAFVGQKRFSVEGTDTLVPILDTVIEEAAAGGASDVVIGMAHRGRLNVLTHVLGKPYELMIAAFAGRKLNPATDSGVEDLSQDVKYHLGWREAKRIGDREVTVTLAPNPSHLEFVDPVVVGMTRAAQDWTRRPGPPDLSLDDGVAVLVHGDAAFPGQGVVAETFNMSGLRGYTVGGTIHIIANNQIGFTTLPEDDRSTRYSSDLAKGFEVPIVHVNADDAEACLSVARLAIAYREEFHKDFVIDLVGYRRWGHNEGDEPAFTQPRMYEIIRSHPTTREQLAERLVTDGVVTRAEADALLQEVLDRLSEVQASLGEGAALPHVEEHSRNGGPRSSEIRTAVPAERLVEFNEGMLRRPEGFTPNARLEKLLARRRDVMGPEGGIDWGHAEALAFASLLADGVPVRLSGQDAERGTFSHRHLVLHDANTGAKHTPLSALPQARASFEVQNSPLSEMAVVGFEYGYTVFDPDVLVIWEAQFGDFANGAQVMIDQFLAASYQKWGQTSGLVMLLPHGYEGQGPEHSSARLERFLQLAAENNFRVVNCTTSAQYFHLLRRQAQLLARDPRPLIVMSPKSLLRHPLAASRLEQLANGSFQCVIGDETAVERAEKVSRLLLCSGKVYADLVASPLRAGARNVALARVEELYPFPRDELAGVVRSLPALQEVVWVQEEPRNMGAWTYMAPRLQELLEGIPLRYEGRPERAAPAEGSAGRHTAEQARIVEAAWSGAPEPENPAERRARGDTLIGKRKL